LQSNKPVCVLATHLLLLKLKSRTYGSLMRLRILAAAALEAGFALVVCTSIEESDLAGSLEQTTDAMTRELRDAWGLEARVIAAVRAPGGSLPWAAQQLAGMFSYRRNWFARKTLSAPVMAALRRALDLDPAVIIAHRLPAMTALLDAGARAPIVFDLDDIEHRVLARGISRLATLRDKIVAAGSLPALYLAERRAMRRAAITLVCSPGDADVVRNTHGAGAVHVMPNSVEMPELAPGATRRVLLMVGIYSYGPNGDGANWFLESVWPRIAAAAPDVEAWFVGANPQSIASHAHPPARVKFLGFVDSLADAYRAARVVICPIRYGGGTRVKLVEASGWGKAIVTTTLGAEGLGMVPGEHALFADDADAFAASCVRLLDDEAQGRALGARARELADRTFRRENVIRVLAGQLAGLAGANNLPDGPSG
jgi:glycosyltransferase involved in cell wall biosynthesis